MNPIPLLRRAAVALCGLALVWTASPVQAQTDPPTRVVRVAEVQGQALWFDTDSREWQPLLRNQTLTEGDRLRVDPQGRVGLRVGPHALWLDERSQMELMRVDDGRLELGLDRGSVALRLVTREGARETRVRTPEGRFQFDGVGDYRVDVLPRASRAQVYDGRLRFDHRGQDDAPLWLDGPEAAEVWWDGGPRAERSKLLRHDDFGAWLVGSAGFGREDLSRYASRPAYRYVSPELNGADELDAHGRWETSPEFGPIWTPLRVAVDWAPYRYGRWTWHRVWGWTWVDDLPWGYATSHYGRWVYWRNRWCWAPGRVVVTRPVYAPALVAWVGHGPVQVGVHVGVRPPLPTAWVPLAPYEAYRPWYRHTPDHVRRINPDPDPVTVRRPVPGWTGHNRAVPGAISAYAPEAEREGPNRGVPLRPMPVRDEQVLRQLTPVAEAPAREALPWVRGRPAEPRVDRTPEAGPDRAVPPPVAAMPRPERAPSVEREPEAGVPWRRSEPATPRAAEPVWREERREDRREERREDVRPPRPDWRWDNRSEPRPEPRPEARPEPRREESRPARRDEGVPWRSAPTPQVEPPRRMEPPPSPPRVEPPRRAEPSPSVSVPRQRERERGDDDVPRRRGEMER